MEETIKSGSFIQQNEEAVKKFKVCQALSPDLGLHWRHSHQEEKVAEAVMGLL